MIRDVEVDGFKYRVVVPDDAPEETWQYGVRVGPPDLNMLGLPLSIELRLNNELFNRRMFTAVDIRKRYAEVEASLRAALATDVQRILEAYAN